MVRWQKGHVWGSSVGVMGVGCLLLLPLAGKMRFLGFWVQAASGGAGGGAVGCVGECVQFAGASQGKEKFNGSQQRLTEVNGEEMRAGQHNGASGNSQPYLFFILFFLCPLHFIFFLFFLVFIPILYFLFCNPCPHSPSLSSSLSSSPRVRGA